MSRHQITLFHDNGTPIQVLEGYTFLRYTRVVNGLGRFEIILPESSFDWRSLDVDDLVEIWRAPKGKKLQWQMTGFLRNWGVELRRGVTSIFMEGPGQNHLLDNKIVAYKGNQDESQKSAESDDVMKELARENVGPSAGNDPYGRDRNTPNFTVAADNSQGPVYTGDLQWQFLLEVLQDISDHAHSKGTPIYFDVEQVGTANFRFQTYKNQRGLDRTVSPFNMTFGPEFGNMDDPRWEEDWSDERNLIYGGGPGQGQARMIDPEKDLGRMYRSQWNIREAMQDARGETTFLGIAKKAFARLVESRPRRVLSGRLKSVPGSLYGIDWGFGDLVKVSAFGLSSNAHIRSVTISVDGKRRETVDARVEIEYTRFDPDGITIGLDTLTLAGQVHDLTVV